MILALILYALLADHPATPADARAVKNLMSHGWPASEAARWVAELAR